jgi:hypothetical protein
MLHPDFEPARTWLQLIGRYQTSRQEDVCSMESRKKDGGELTRPKHYLVVDGGLILGVSGTREIFKLG